MSISSQKSLDDNFWDKVVCGDSLEVLKTLPDSSVHLLLSDIPYGIAVGALVIAIIDNGLGLLGLPAGINFLVTGGVLILAATVDAVSRKRSSAAR